MSVRKIHRDPGPQTEGYKGVFKGISENLDVGVGKYAPPIGMEQREHHYNIGWKPWQQSNETVYEVDYKPNKEIVKRDNCANMHPPTIHIDHINVPYKKDTHFNSEYKNYKDYQNPPRAKPIRDKLTLMATQIVMGDDHPNYKTAQLIAQEPKPPQRQLVYHPKPEKYDIITNHEANQERLKKASAFDYWNPTSEKKHQSFNTSEIPQYRLGSRDPITGRFIS
ncbi:unnamed protein product [Paramecium octaurelia]|uniref:Uncharacterized protein n=1 Tax=Paramecium octaurelia TaxID=43137 RepID=A0A8S1UYJ2_PAROT|nr:unnamed protein product [Paramecium octaurelia]